MKRPPLILITPSSDQKGVEFHDHSVSLSDAYPRAIQQAGGVPWIMGATPSPQVVAESVRCCDGVMLTGGDDIAAELSAPQAAPALKKKILGIDRARDYAELLVIQEVFRQRKPLLAICRGLQILNVALGGDLIVDIPTQVPRGLRHARMDAKTRPVHRIELAPGSLLRKLLRREMIGVNSTHHQAAGRVAEALRVTAWSRDGVVEALELNLAEQEALPYLLAVQFHPERLLERQPEFMTIFRSFLRVSAVQSTISL